MGDYKKIIRLSKMLLDAVEAKDMIAMATCFDNLNNAYGEEFGDSLESFEAYMAYTEMMLAGTKYLVFNNFFESVQHNYNEVKERFEGCCAFSDYSDAQKESIGTIFKEIEVIAQTTPKKHKNLTIPRHDTRCSLCRVLPANKTGCHLVPNFMIQGIFSFDGKAKRGREIAMRDGLNWGERMTYYGSSVATEAINADRARDLNDEELDNNINNLEYDNLFCKSCEDRFGLLETYYAPFYSSYKQDKVDGRMAYLFWMSVFWRMCVGRMSIFLKGDDEFELRRILNDNVTTLEAIEKGNNDLGDFGYVLWRTKGLQKGDSGIYGTRTEHSPYMIVLNDMVVMLLSDVSKLKGEFYYAGWRITPESINTYRRNGEKVYDISMEKFAKLKRFVLDESEKYGWGPAQEQVKVQIREKDRTAGRLHSIGSEREKWMINTAKNEDDSKQRPFFFRNMDKFFMAEIKEYAFKMEGKDYDILDDRNLFLFPFDLVNYKKDIWKLIREGSDVSAFPYVDKLFDGKYWEGKEGYLMKQGIIKSYYEDVVSKGYTFEDIVNNMRTRSGEME